MASTEASREDAAEALRATETAISDTSRRLRELANERRQLQAQIAALADKSRQMAARRSEEEKQLSQVLRSQWLLLRSSPWREIVAARSPQQRERDLVYLDYLARDRVHSVETLRSSSDEIAELEALTRSKETQLANLADDEATNHTTLLRQKADHAKALDRVARQVATQRRSLAGLQRDEQRLSGLIEQLERVLAERARKAAKTRTDPPSAGPKVARAAPAPSPTAPEDAEFAQLRGKLVLPVRGEVTARFGSPRRTEAGVDAPTWKGVFIRSAAGADVKVVAAGRVIFADWLRGFGNLMVVDHGEGFLSVYGNNEALLANVGDSVAAGNPIATVGSSGGNAEPGLYFELRFQGRPVDPLRWAQAR